MVIVKPEYYGPTAWRLFPCKNTYFPNRSKYQKPAPLLAFLGFLDQITNISNMGKVALRRYSIDPKSNASQCEPGERECHGVH